MGRPASAQAGPGVAQHHGAQGHQQGYQQGVQQSFRASSAGPQQQQQHTGSLSQQQHQQQQSGVSSLRSSVSRGRRPVSAPPAYAPNAQWADSNTFKVTTRTLDATVMLGHDHQPAHVALLSAHNQYLRSKARPKSACVSAAAWKAYGSPRARGIVRPPPAPSPAHPKSAAQGGDALGGWQPTTGVLGGGYNYPPAGANHAAAQAAQQHTQHHGGSRPTTPSGRPASPSFLGRMIPDPPVPAAPQLLQPFQGRTVEILAAVNEGVGLESDEYRYLPTRPTDPNAQRQWGSILAKFEATRSSTTRLHHHRPRSPGPSHAGGGASRPQSAGGGVAYSLVRASHHQPEYGAFPAGAGSHGGGGGGGARPASARMRFTSLSVGEVQRLGAGYAPVALPGAAPPQSENVLPAASDDRWTCSRMGASALTRLHAGLKLPMSAAMHTGSPNRPISPHHHPAPAAAAAPPDPQSPGATQRPGSAPHAETLLHRQQAELTALLEAQGLAAGGAPSDAGAGTAEPPDDHAQSSVGAGGGELPAAADHLEEGSGGAAAAEHGQPAAVAVVGSAAPLHRHGSRRPSSASSSSHAAAAAGNGSSTLAQQDPDAAAGALREPERPLPEEASDGERGLPPDAASAGASPPRSLQGGSANASLRSSRGRADAATPAAAAAAPTVAAAVPPHEVDALLPPLAHAPRGQEAQHYVAASPDPAAALSLGAPDGLQGEDAHAPPDHAPAHLEGDRLEPGPQHDEPLAEAVPADSVLPPPPDLLQPPDLPLAEAPHLEAQEEEEEGQPLSAADGADAPAEFVVRRPASSQPRVMSARPMTASHGSPSGGAGGRSAAAAGALADMHMIEEGEDEDVMTGLDEEEEEELA